MRPTVYVETTVVSYATARPSRDLIIAARQQITREWWVTCKDRFDVYSSELTIGEAAKGDPEYATVRVKQLACLPQLRTLDEATSLAQALLDAKAIPAGAEEDALHIAIAVVNGMNYLVTCNMRHIGSARMRHRIDDCCRITGFVPTVICSPAELMED
jgi:hypothetical protein